ncbi:MAG TPA: hypothetical protein VMN60_08595, partial [Longimicrobiales bacterium]|nr:hypothetical protein [Longimicrobiales bacterium]
HPRWHVAPSIVLSIAGVRPLVSEVRDTIAAGNELHGRFGVQLYWLVPLRTWLEAEVDGRWFTGFGMDQLVADAGLDEGAFVDGRMSLVLRQPVGPVRVDRLFVGYAHGRQPTDAEQRKAWTAGARLTAR